MTTEAALSRAQIEAPEIAPYLVNDDEVSLQMPKCRRCAHLQWPPRPFCAQCGGADFQAVPIEPVGELYSWTTTHRAPTPELAQLVPYTVVVIALHVPEPVRVLGRLHETNRVPDLTVGLRMRGTREPAEHGTPLLTWSIDD
jgi:uncharacterized protein